MRPEARRLLLELLRHHRAVTTRNPAAQTGRIVESSYTIHYGDLCTRAGVPHIVRVVGQFLGEIAVWCRERDFPPLNSLAVNADSGIPGEGYDGAGGYRMKDWTEEVAQTVRFKGFPLEVP